MNNECEYHQAVDNMAAQIVKYSKRDFYQFRDDNVDNTDLMVKYIADNQKIQQDWARLEVAAKIITEQYDVDYSTLLTDVWQVMLCLDPDSRSNASSIKTSN